VRAAAAAATATADDAMYRKLADLKLIGLNLKMRHGAIVDNIATNL